MTKTEFYLFSSQISTLQSIWFYILLNKWIEWQTIHILAHLFTVENKADVQRIHVYIMYNLMTIKWLLKNKHIWTCSVQISSVSQSCQTLWDPMNHSMPGLPVHHQLPEFTQTHVHQVGDAIQPSHPLSSPSPPALNPSQHQGLFQWVSSSHEVTKVLEFQLQHQFFQWTPRTDLL